MTEPAPPDFSRIVGDLRPLLELSRDTKTPHLVVGVNRDLPGGEYAMSAPFLTAAATIDLLGSALCGVLRHCDNPAAAAFIAGVLTRLIGTQSLAAGER